MMDAQPELALIARVLNENGLEAILIGNMAAALHGAPVSTIDIDLYFRKTSRNMQKLKRIAIALEATLLRPFHPVSALIRLQRESDGLQIDFMGHIDGVQSYEGVRKRAATLQFGGQKLLTASLDDIISSKKAAGRGKDLAVIDILEKTRDEEKIPKDPRTHPG
jgi:predicted nucleotidyltransferase